MPIIALGYLGVRSRDLGAWGDYASAFLGLQKIDAGGGTLSFRMDDWRQRLVVSDEPGSTMSVMGWQVDTPDDLDHFAAALERAGTRVTRGTAALCDQRFVAELIAFDDPDGNHIELFHSPETTTDPFVSGRPIEGFVTGAFGMGHAVLHVRDAAALVPFYRDILGFNVSDYGLEPYQLYFFHVNGRHHSFAMIGSGRTGFHHFMVEYANLDDVGQGYDLALQQQEMIAYTLGRHTNDYMTSFYSKTPSDFFVESGWGGRIIDPDTWTPHETNVGPSFWGHDRPLMSDELRAAFSDMRLQAAASGRRTPNVRDCPWLYDQLTK